MKAPVYNPDWSDLVKAVYTHDMEEMWDASITPHIYNYYHAELERYLAIAGEEPLRILDVGCAQGTLALLLAEAGHHVTAVDLREEFLEYARSRYEKGHIEFIQGNAMELALPDQYDLIFANQIVEHLVYPVEMLKGLAEMLVPSGRLVATTPNGRYLKSNLPSFGELGDVSQYEDQQFFPDGDGHFFAYEPNELREVFSNAGLCEADVSARCSPWISGHMKFRYVHGKLPYGTLLALDRFTLNIPGLREKLGYQLLGCGRKAS